MVATSTYIKILPILLAPIPSKFLALVNDRPIPINVAIEIIQKNFEAKDDNPELIAAKKANIPITSRADILAQLMESRKCICVSGTHGKTTTTSMISWVLSQGPHKPTSIIGGIDSHTQSNLQIGSSDWMVVEADESDKTFVKLPSKISVITNIDYDHLEAQARKEKPKSVSGLVV